MDKILLTGVCYVHRLLQLRYEESAGIQGPHYIRAVHPHFDIGKIRFFREGISDKFLFTDFHGKYSSIETEASSLPELLRLYQNKCRLMYVVGATGIRNIDVASILTPKDYEKISAFWYFMFDEEWNPHRVKQWSEQRDRAILSLLGSFPNLKFILYQDSCIQWWRKMGIPESRLVIWRPDWGMSNKDFEEIRQSIISQGLSGAHRFPTEESYNELCDMILKDYEDNGSNPAGFRTLETGTQRIGGF